MLDGVFVDFDAQSRALGNVDHAIAELGRSSDKFFTKRILVDVKLQHGSLGCARP